MNTLIDIDADGTDVRFMYDANHKSQENQTVERKLMYRASYFFNTTPFLTKS